MAIISHYGQYSYKNNVKKPTIIAAGILSFRREVGTQEGLPDLRHNLWIRRIGKDEDHLVALDSCYDAVVIFLCFLYETALHSNSSASNGF